MQEQQAKLIYEYNSYITLEFEKPHWNTIHVVMETQTLSNQGYVPREKIISHIMKNLDGTQHLTTARERAVVFCTKMRITNNPYNILVRGISLP